MLRIKRYGAGVLLSLGVLGVTAIGPSSASAALIGPNEIVGIPQTTLGSGNGTLDLRMFTFSGSEIKNESGSFNGDNGNNSLPNGLGSSDTGSFVESYVTTGAELKAFYALNFPPNTINQIAVYLDLNETGNGQANNTLAKFDVVINPTTIQGNPNPAGDVTSAEQAAIDQVYTGGTLAAKLSPEPAANLPVNQQGAGWADYAILTGINPFALNDSDVVLFNVSMNTLNNGGEELFLSGTYAPQDVGVTPEPGSAAVIALAAGTLSLARRGRRRA